MKSDRLLLNAYHPDDRVLEGNRFLLGNGHLGYRGTLEEETKAQMTGFNLVGVYDQRGDLWRESLNFPDPLCLVASFENQEQSVLSSIPLSHEMELAQEEEVLYRKTSFESLFLSSERFLSFAMDNLLASRLEIEAKKDGEYEFRYGLDLDVFDCNGPHFVSKTVTRTPSFLLFEGVTNEGKHVYEAVAYRLNRPSTPLGESFFEAKTNLKKGQKAVLEIYAMVFEEPAVFKKQMEEALEKGYDRLKEEHVAIFQPLYRHAKVHLEGNAQAEEDANYSLYMLLILGDPHRPRSIPARGVSGQTYKGAVFWDSEIFLLPFFALQNPKVARNLVLYRILTLPGAIHKAKGFGFEGAFYAWESQEDGRDACSKYNVTDYKTGRPVRTYFDQKQIHISADIVYAYENYERLTGDESLLSEGGDEMLCQIALFYLSRASFRNDQYHFDDVIGPDEYHEGVNDNAFTNYMAAHALRYIEKKLSTLPGQEALCSRIQNFLNHLYLPKPNDHGLIEQFEGYFQKEDCSVDEVRSRLKDPRQYWGGDEGPATPTQVIKQADVAALLALLGDEFPLEVKKANYDYYFPRTEHGSSLSSSMYSLLASEIGEKEEAEKMFSKSACIDLRGPQKLYAGGIYIGGSHPASEGGAYSSLIYGFAGFHPEGRTFTLHPALPQDITGMEFSLYYQSKRYHIRIQGNQTRIEEEAA